MRTVDQFNAKIDELGLNFFVPEPGVPGQGNCFFEAVLLMAKQPTHRPTLNPEVSLPVNAMDFRLQVINFMDSQLQDDENFQLLKVPITSNWSDYVLKMRNPSEWADEIVIHATALYLKKDIFLLRVSSGIREVHWHRIPGSFGDEPSSPPPLTLAYQDLVHFEPLIEKSELSKNVCLCCGWTGKSLKAHI